jgi:hypothetical protein
VNHSAQLAEPLRNGTDNPMGGSVSTQLTPMFGLQYLTCTLTDDDAGRHGVTRHHARHDRAIRDAKVVDSVDLEVGVHDRRGIATHFCGACLMVVSTGCVADELFKRRAFQVARHDLAFCVRSKRSRIANFAAKLDTSYCSLHIIWVRQQIGLYLHGVVRIGHRQANPTADLGRTTPPYNVQEAAGGLNLAAVSALQNGTSIWHVCKSGVSRAGLLFQKNVASPPLLRGASGR